MSKRVSILHLPTKELRERHRQMLEEGRYTTSPNDIARELDRRAARREGLIATWSSIVGIGISIIAVVLSAIALIQGAAR